LVGVHPAENVHKERPPGFVGGRSCWIAAMRLKVYGWIGLAVVAVAEACLVVGQPFVSRYFTPIVWTGYILFADAVALHLRGTSIIHDRPREAVMLGWISAGCWVLFEAYNLRLKNWVYVGVPEQPLQRTLAYLWSFATIMPGMFETADVLAGLGFARKIKARPHVLSAGARGVLFLVGLAFVLIPPMLPVRVARYTFAFVWVGFILLLEPVNMMLGANSPLSDWLRGDPRPGVRLLAAGMVCGFLWEFWNFWATASWRYALPWPLDFGVYYFRMPVLGLLGFPPFAWECWAMFQFLKRLLNGDVLWQSAAAGGGSE
jgi:hypothetical protein